MFAALSSWCSLSLLAVCLLFPSAGIAAPEKSCVECHKKLVSKRIIHPVISQFVKMEQGCPSCHDAPHGKNKATKSLTQAVPDLCYQCHDKEKFTKTTVHPPVAAGDCISCHNPHSSDTAALLVQPVPYLCTTCHEDKKDGKHVLAGTGVSGNHPVRGKKDPQRPRSELGCSSCHSPHSSPSPRLFVKDTKDSQNLCKLCHVRVIVRP